MIKWKAIQIQSLDGDLISWTLEDLNEITLQQIQALPRKISIDFESAYRMQRQECVRLLYQEHDVKQYEKLSDNWINWISDQGYHIKLTGQEYEEVLGEPALPEPESALAESSGPEPITIKMIWAGKTYEILTSSDRPPIQSIVEINSRLIEIHYETGEVEKAKSGGTEGDFMVATLFHEFMLGDSSPVKKFTWAA